MTKIQYYRLKFRLASPLAIGSGENSRTDSDVIIDSAGNPVIPATAIAGAVRHYLGVEYNSENEFFGYINGENSCESKIKFYDAVLTENGFVTVRDSVALEDKVGKDGAKFDIEAIETNAEFVTLVEVNSADEAETEKILDSFSAINQGFLRIGSKTTRGYGQLEITEIKKAEFTLPDNKREWLDFCPYDYASDSYYKDITAEIKSRKFCDRFTRIHLELKQRGAISIRSYTVKDSKDISSADYIQLETHDGTPVIPGTSWAGAFKQRFSEFENPDGKITEHVKQVWGCVEGNDIRKSKIHFSESRIKNHTSKIITRNSIDRFSAGTKDGALYTEKTSYNGRCTLDIDVKKDVEDFDKCMKLLCAVICDIDRGYLSVGGLTSVGRGMFEVEKIEINNTDVTTAMKTGNIEEMTGGKA